MGLSAMRSMGLVVSGVHQVLDPAKVHAGRRGDAFGVFDPSSGGAYLHSETASGYSVGYPWELAVVGRAQVERAGEELKLPPVPAACQVGWNCARSYSSKTRQSGI